MKTLRWSDLLCEEKRVKIRREQKTANDTRSIFEMDYHRIVSSASFRRLQDKAQVFPLEKFDFVRTRLTHSIEVASLARSLGRDLVQFVYKKEPCENIKYIPTILDCAGLLHDIGNPPFGHFGEQSIRDWFKVNLPKIYFSKEKKYHFEHQDRKPRKRSVSEYRLIDILSEQQLNDFYNFEGNAQTLRNATKLNYIIDENSLNLSYPLLATIVKYPVNSQNINKKNPIKKKPGYFYSEESDFEDIISCTKINFGSMVTRHPLTYLLEAADDISYLTDDIEDAFNKKKLRVIDIEKHITKTHSEEKCCMLILDKIQEYEAEAIRQEYKNIEMYIIQRLKIYIQGNLVNAVSMSFQENYEKIMTGEFNKSLLEVCSWKDVRNLLDELARKFVFSDREILLTEIKGHKIIDGILNELIIRVLC